MSDENLTAEVVISPDFTIGAIDRRLFGSFVEHLGRRVYDGIYEPGHPTADEDGFRQDVIELVRELGVTTIRYPGGNFVSGFRWEDSVGPREQRPRRLDLAWHSTETNEVGLHEFAALAGQGRQRARCSPSTSAPAASLEALDLLEYANIRGGTALADRRIANGRDRAVRRPMWCLGNEMDGPVAARPPLGRRLRQARRADREGPCASSTPTSSSWSAAPPARACRRSASGSASCSSHTYDDVDYISCHAYYEEKDGDLDSFLASAVDMDRFIESVVATADHVKAPRAATRRSTSRSTSGTSGTSTATRRRQDHRRRQLAGGAAPARGRLLGADAVVFGSLLISLLKHADRVTRAASRSSST